MASFGLVTCDRYPDVAPDDRPLAEELVGRGHHVESVPWTADERSQRRHDLLVLRSAWDVWQDEPTYRSYVAWLEFAETLPMANPATVASWSLDKRYIANLRIPGLHVPVTTEVEAGTIASTLESLGWDQAVLKPSVGADGDLVELIDRDRARDLDRNGTPHTWCPWLLQEFIPTIRDHGETSVVLIDGALAHAVLKRPSDREWRTNSQFQPQPVSRTTVALRPEILEAVADALPRPWLYTRIDLVIAPDRIVLLEIETGDPKLWFTEATESAVLMADALERWLQLDEVAGPR